MVQLTLLRRLDAFNRVLACRDTFLSKIVREALALARFEPSLLARFHDDVERWCRDDKKVRLMDGIFREEQLPRFPGFEDMLEPCDFDPVDAQEFGLHEGRPRAVDGEMLLVLLVINGVVSLTSRAGYDRLVESEVFGAFLEAKGMRLPSRSTVARYLEMVSEDTHRLLHRALLAKAKAEGLDDFTELTVDSTAVEANSAWPTDSGLIFGYLRRADNLLRVQAKYTGVAYESKLVERWLPELERTHKSIQMLPSRPGSAAERRRLYRSLLHTARKTEKKIRELLERRLPEIRSCCILPSLRLRVDRILEELHRALDEAGRTAAVAGRRVLLGETVPAKDKAFSLADPDAYMISKGGREPVLGYKPQIGRSASGFISGFEVLAGNPADSERLAAMVERHREATAVVPGSVSTDDGYSSADNLRDLRELGVKRVSFSGSKGRAVLGEELWNAPEQQSMRRDRSAVESGIFTLKHHCNLRRFCRHGLDGVRKDLSEATLAYNLWRMAFVRARKREEGPPAAAAA